MPEEFVTKWKKQIKPQWKLAFISSIIIGLLTHMYVFTNALPNHDSLINIYGSQRKYSLGRFFLSPFSGVSSYFDLPWINGVLSILYLALTVVILVELFKLKKSISIVLTAGIIVTFPTITATFSYMFTADGYMFGSLLTVLAILVTQKYKFGFLPGAFLFYLGVGVYQANLPFLLTLITILAISDILSRTVTLKELPMYILRYLGLTIVGMGLYAVTFKLYSNYFAGNITSYQGLDEVGYSSSTFMDQYLILKQTFKEFFFRGFITDLPINLFEILNAIIFAAIILGIVLLIIQNKLYKNIPLLFIVVILLISLPITSYCLFFVSPGVIYHMLMVISLTSIYLLPIILYDRFILPTIFNKSVSWIIVLTTFVIIFNFAIISNISYFNMNLKNEKSVSFVNRLIMRIEQTEGYTPENKLALIGRIRTDSHITKKIVPENIPVMTGALGQNYLVEQYHYKAIMENQFGLKPRYATVEERKNIKESDVFKKMGIWPAENSIQFIDGILVIKLSK